GAGPRRRRAPRRARRPRALRAGAHRRAGAVSRGGVVTAAAATRAEALARFRAGYGAHRAAEGRGAGGTAELLALPYLFEGPQAAQWKIRSRTYHAFAARVMAPLAALAGRPLRILDLGAGNGWLCYRAALLGHEPTAVDVRDDSVDGLGAAAGYDAHLPK